MCLNFSFSNSLACLHERRVVKSKIQLKLEMFYTEKTNIDFSAMWWGEFTWPTQPSWWTEFSRSSPPQKTLFMGDIFFFGQREWILKSPDWMTHASQWICEHQLLVLYHSRGGRWGTTKALQVKTHHHSYFQKFRKNNGNSDFLNASNFSRLHGRPCWLANTDPVRIILSNLQN